MQSGHKLRISSGGAGPCDGGLRCDQDRAIKTVREGRDSASERLFDLIYGTSPWPNASRAGES